nr:MAG: hypothetical protein [uncultured archaeon]
MPEDKKQKRFDGELQLKEPLNPEICLYHTTQADRLMDILKKGLDPYSVKTCERGIYEAVEEEGITDEDEISEWLSECRVPSVHARGELDSVLNRQESVYFVKDEDNILRTPSLDTVVEVPAELIPCKCVEDNYELENELYDLIYGSYSDYSPSPDQEEIWAKTEEVEATIRPLDIKKNPYTTEVLCPCHIPANIIKPYRTNKIGSCVIKK